MYKHLQQKIQSHRALPATYAQDHAATVSRSGPFQLNVISFCFFTRDGNPQNPNISSTHASFDLWRALYDHLGQKFSTMFRIGFYDDREKKEDFDDREKKKEEENGEYCLIPLARAAHSHYRLGPSHLAVALRSS